MRPPNNAWRESMVWAAAGFGLGAVLAATVFLGAIATIPSAMPLKSRRL